MTPFWYVVEFVGASKKMKENETKQKSANKKERRGSRRLVQVVFLFVAKFVFFSLFRSSSSSLLQIVHCGAPWWLHHCQHHRHIAALLQSRNKGMVWSSRTFCRKSPTLNAPPPHTLSIPFHSLRFGRRHCSAVDWLALGGSAPFHLHTWTPLPWRWSIWALIVCMLLMIFFWWPTSEMPRLITSLQTDRRRERQRDGQRDWRHIRQTVIYRWEPFSLPWVWQRAAARHKTRQSQYAAFLFIFFTIEEIQGRCK